MSKEAELNLEQIKLSLSDYQAELDAIDAETDREKKRLQDAIQAEEAEIKYLLDRYRDLKRQKELEEIKSSYNHLANFKQILLLKIKSETENTKNLPISSKSEKQLTKFTDPLLIEGNSLQQQKEQLVGKEVTELIQFIERIAPEDLVKFYPADIAISIPSFDVNNTEIRNKLLSHYQEHNISTYNALIKLYQKPNLNRTIIEVPEPNTLPLKDRGYHSFLEENYPKSLPFFWFLINREPDTIKYVVMEFAIDHIIQTNTLEEDLERQDLNLELSELLEMNESASTDEFLRDIFISFHPRRVSHKTNSKNKYFDYVTNLIQTQTTLEYSEVLQIWNYMLNSGYDRVASPNFEVVLPLYDEPTDNSLDLVSSSQDQLS